MFTLHVDTALSWRGGQNQVLLTVLGLQALGHRTALVAQPNGELVRRATGCPDLISIASVGEVDLPAAWRLSRALKKLNPAIVQAHDAQGVAMVALARSLVRLEPQPRFVVSRRVDFHIQRNIFSRWKYSQVDRFLCASEAIRTMIIEDGIPLERTETLHEGIDFKLVEASPGLNLYKEFQFPKGTYIVGNVAALVPHKGQQFLIEAAAKVISRIPNVRFVILGAGKLESRLRSQIQRLGLEQYVLLAGFRPDVLSLQKGFDLFVMSSTTEGLGTTLLDAMALGRPIIATRTGGIPEVVDAETGILVPPCDPQALATAIVDLLRDPARRARLGTAARTRVREQFSAERMIQRTLDAYLRLADTPPAGDTVRPRAAG
jgi:glycosyltransferase involved in cell wall biosynthesis